MLSNFVLIEILLSLTRSSFDASGRSWNTSTFRIDFYISHVYNSRWLTPIKPVIEKCIKNALVKGRLHVILDCVYLFFNPVISSLFVYVQLLLFLLTDS